MGPSKQWLHVSAVLGHLQVIGCFTINNNKEKTCTWDNVYLEVLYISGVQRDLVVNGILLVRAYKYKYKFYWLEHYKYKYTFYWLELSKYKIRLNLGYGMEKTSIQYL